MDNEIKSLENTQQTEENEKSEKNIIEAVGNSAKKIIVPVALTVGLLSNDSAAIDMAIQRNLPDTSNIAITETYTDSSSPVTLDSDFDDTDEDDEEKKSYKGSSLIKASAYSSLGTVFGAIELAVGDLLSESAFAVVSLFGKFGGIFAIVSILFMGMFKAIYPNRSLKEIISTKNVARTASASGIILAAFYLIDSIIVEGNIYAELGKNAIILSVVLGLWFKVFELKGKFGQVMKDLFWGKKGKLLFALMVGVNVAVSMGSMAYKSVFDDNSFAVMLSFYIVCMASVAVIYNLAKGRMVEDDELK